MKKYILFLLIIISFLVSSCSSDSNNNSDYSSSGNSGNGSTVTEFPTKVYISEMSDFKEYFTFNTNYDSSYLPISFTITPKSGVTVESVSYSRYYSGKWQSRYYAIGGACAGFSGGMLTQCRQFGYDFYKTYATNRIGTVTFNNNLEDFYKWFNINSNENVYAVIYI